MKIKFQNSQRAHKQYQIYTPSAMCLCIYVPPMFQYGFLASRGSYLYFKYSFYSVDEPIKLDSYKQIAIATARLCSCFNKSALVLYVKQTSEELREHNNGSAEKNVLFEHLTDPFYIYTVKLNGEEQCRSATRQGISLTDWNGQAKVLSGALAFLCPFQEFLCLPKTQPATLDHSLDISGLIE